MGGKSLLESQLNKLGGLKGHPTSQMTQKTTIDPPYEKDYSQLEEQD